MVRVSDVENLRGGKVRITLDDGRHFLLLRSAYLDRPLEPGQEVDPAEYADWVLHRQYRSALDLAVSMLAARACSRGEIERKLRLKDYSPETVEKVLYKLESNHLLDDRAFADQWARYRAGMKYGPHRISQELRRKGVSSEDAETALDSVPESDQLESAVALAEKALRRGKADEDPRKARQRILAAIVRRGYGWDIARKAVDSVLSDPEET